MDDRIFHEGKNVQNEKFLHFVIQAKTLFFPKEKNSLKNIIAKTPSLRSSSTFISE